MHIGFITCELTHQHGWAHYSTELITHLHQAGVQVTVLASRGSPTDFDFPVYPILPAPETRALPLHLLAARHTAARLLRACDAVHVTVEPFAPLGAWVKRDRPLWIGGVGTYVQLPAITRPPVSWLYRASFAAAAGFICISHHTERVLRQVMPGVRACTVPLAANPQRFAHLVRRKTDGVRPTLLTVGAIKPRKGTRELLRALSEVRRQVPDVLLVIIGSLTADARYVAQVRADIEALGLGDTVQLLGYVPEAVLLEWYAAADMFVLPSLNLGVRFEGFGLVHLEASAAGLPVVGTRDCGAEDAIDHNVTGLLVSQARIAEELPAALLRLLGDADLRARMGAAGRHKAQRYTWDDVARGVIAAYKGPA